MEWWQATEPGAPARFTVLKGGPQENGDDIDLAGVSKQGHILSPQEMDHRPEKQPEDVRTVSKEKLFAWLSAMKIPVMYPGMRERLGSINFDEIQRAVDDMEKVIGVIKGDQGFNG